MVRIVIDDILSWDKEDSVLTYCPSGYCIVDKLTHKTVATSSSKEELVSWVNGGNVTIQIGNEEIELKNKENENV